MDKADRERLLTYYDLKQEILKKKSIAEDIKEMVENENQRSFENGKIIAYDQVLLMLEFRIKEIRGSMNKAISQ